VFKLILLISQVILSTLKNLFHSQL